MARRRCEWTASVCDVDLAGVAARQEVGDQGEEDEQAEHHDPARRRRRTRSRSSRLRPHLQMEPALLLQVAEHGEEVARLRIAARTEHAHEALGRRAGGAAERLEADRRIDVVAQDGLAGLEVAFQHARHRFLQKRLAEVGIAPGARLDGVLEISQTHLAAPLSCAAGSRPNAPAPPRCRVAGAS
jgi:hypothetical protein